MKQTCDTCIGRDGAPCEGCLKKAGGTRSLWAPEPCIVPKTIADRAVAEIRRTARLSGITVTAERNRIGIGRRVFSGWQAGECTPAGYSLACMAEHDYDVHYILTGVRKWRPNEQE